MRIVSEPEFRKALIASLIPLRGKCFSVVGPGRSGAVASVYASHYLKIAWIPYLKSILVPPDLQPILLIDTASKSGRTLRKAAKRINGVYIQVYLFQEPPFVKFFYESKNPTKVMKNPK